MLLADRRVVSGSPWCSPRGHHGLTFLAECPAYTLARTGTDGDPEKRSTMSVVPTLEYDEEANALYLRFSSGDIDETIVLSDSVYVDVDANGDPVGIEILHATPKELPSATSRVRISGAGLALMA